jgi:hypothetical protein
VNALIATASTNIAGHLVGDVIVGRGAVFAQQRSCLHDLAGLAEPALRHIYLPPSLLNWMFAVGAQAFDGRDALSVRLAQRRLARPDRDAVKVHRAGTADAGTAPEFRSGEVQFVPHKPQKWHVGVTVEVSLLAIDSKLCHLITPYDAGLKAEDWLTAMLLLLGVIEPSP